MFGLFFAALSLVGWSGFLESNLRSRSKAITVGMVVVTIIIYVAAVMLDKKRHPTWRD